MMEVSDSLHLRAKSMLSRPLGTFMRAVRMERDSVTLLLFWGGL